MPRRKKIQKRELQPDPKYRSTLVAKFINNLMKDGKKSTAEQIFYRAMDMIEERTGQSGVEVFEKAIDNVKPIIEVKSRRLAAPPIRCPLRFAPTVVLPFRSAGLYRLPLPVPRKQWLRNWPWSSIRHPRIRARRLRSVTTPIKWLRPTRRLRIIAGSLICMMRHIL